jgi:ribosomal-protein-alanine N-acetyltransferase
LPGGFGLIARCFEGGFPGLDGIRGAGFAVCRVASDESELLSIGVAPGYRGRHIGTDLLRTAMERCRRDGARLMFLEVAVDNGPAQRLYEANGFAAVGTRPDYYQRGDGTRASAYTMRCVLDQVLELPAARAS